LPSKIVGVLRRAILMLTELQGNIFELPDNSSPRRITTSARYQTLMGLTLDGQSGWRVFDIIDAMVHQMIK
jgi:hypothetical protein